MENQKRDVGSFKRKKSTVTKISKSEDRLTIMIFKGTGRVRSVKISPRIVLGAFLFFLFYIVGTIILSNSYFNIYRRNNNQAEKISELDREIITTKKSLERAQEHIALFNEYLSEEKEQSPEPMSTVDYTESSLPKLVDISDLEVARDSVNIHVNFNIVNKQSNDKPIGGYIFVLASVKDSEQSEVWVYPSSPLKNGLPVDYKRGQRFFIQRFKTVTGSYSLNKSTNNPLILEILVFGRDGKLILKKVVEV
jgi:hypothetical protein